MIRRTSHLQAAQRSPTNRCCDAVKEVVQLTPGKCWQTSAGPRREADGGISQRHAPTYENDVAMFQEHHLNRCCDGCRKARCLTRVPLQPGMGSMEDPSVSMDIIAMGWLALPAAAEGPRGFPASAEAGPAERGGPRAWRVHPLRRRWRAPCGQRSPHRCPSRGRQNRGAAREGGRRSEEEEHL